MSNKDIPEMPFAEIMAWDKRDNRIVTKGKINFGPNDVPPLFEITITEDLFVLLTIDQIRTMLKIAEIEMARVELSPRDAKIRNAVRKANAGDDSDLLRIFLEDRLKDRETKGPDPQSDKEGDKFDPPDNWNPDMDKEE